MALNMQWFDENEARIPRGETRTRFAPSPTGYMHVGNLRTALYTYLIARHAGGKFILRIEDTDQVRLIESSIDIIYNTLRSCGLAHDEGPDIGGPAGPYIQSHRKEIYGKYADLLLEKGGAYRCFCGQEDGADAHSHREAKHIEKYDGRCARLTDQEIAAKLTSNMPYVVRQKIPRQGTTTISDEVFGDITVENDSLDDNVLIKSDGLPTYNFANVIDDHLMGITHVVRGSEYLSSAPKYNLLYESFGWEIPLYIHCSPVMRDTRHKMSKRNGDPSYEDLVEMGYLPQAILNYVALLGWSPGGEREIFSLEELISIFDVHGISKSPAVFDPEKLNHFNSVYLRAMSPEAFHDIALPYIRRAVGQSAMDTRTVAALLQNRCDRLTDIPDQIDFLEVLPPYSTALYAHKKMKTNEALALSTLLEIFPVLDGLPVWDQESIHDALLGLAEKLGLKNGQVLWPIRIAVSGKQVTPGGGVELCCILGKEESLRRIGLGIEKLNAALS